MNKKYLLVDNGFLNHNLTWLIKIISKIILGDAVEIEVAEPSDV